MGKRPTKYALALIDAAKKYLRGSLSIDEYKQACLEIEKQYKVRRVRRAKTA